MRHSKGKVKPTNGDGRGQDPDRISPGSVETKREILA
jgi:hypothetical protein